MLVPVADGISPERIAAASDNLADVWRSVVDPLRARADRPGRVLILGGGARSTGLYAPDLPVAHGAARVDDHRVAEQESAQVHPVHLAVVGHAAAAREKRAS
jgi:hypothetical protein